MSLYDKASLVQIPSGTKSGTLYSVLPANGDGDFDHTRATSATRVNKDGLIESVASGVPRLDYPLIDGVVQSCPALLLEPSRTNYLRYSEDLSQSNWVKTNTGTGVAPTVTANYAISPDGSQNASRVQFDLNGGTTISDRSRLYQDAGTGTSGSQAYSVYVKSNDSSSHTIVFRALGGSLFEKTVTTEWQRISIDATDNSFYFELGLYGDSATADTADILVWGAQMEEGSYVTSYIPTTSAAVTRNADECNSAGTSAEFNDSEGVLFVEFAALHDELAHRRIAISDGTTSNLVYISFDTASNRILANANGRIMVYTVSDETEFQKAAVYYNATAPKLFVNGVLRETETAMTAITGLSELAFDNGAGGNDFYGKVKQVMVFNEALTDAELETLTS